MDNAYITPTIQHQKKTVEIWAIIVSHIRNLNDSDLSNQVE